MIIDLLNIDSYGDKKAANICLLLSVDPAGIEPATL
jgi:hypothetical protein